MLKHNRVPIYFNFNIWHYKQTNLNWTIIYKDKAYDCGFACLRQLIQLINLEVWNSA